jgi:hypothetical protein
VDDLSLLKTLFSLSQLNLGFDGHSLQPTCSLLAGIKELVFTGIWWKQVGSRAIGERTGPWFPRSEWMRFDTMFRQHARTAEMLCPRVGKKRKP